MSWPVPPHGFLGSQASTAATDNDTYQISKSLRFNSADSTYLSRTPSVAGNRKTWTWSGWVKKANSGVAAFICADPNSGSRATSFYTRSLTDGRLEFEHFDGTTTYNLTAADLLRDPSSYYHLVVAVDTTQATNTNRTKIYKNGALLALSGTYVPQNTDMDINNNVRHNLGRFQSASVGVASYLDGYLAEVNFIDGQALTPSSFGETDATTGRWKAKAYTGTYGTNGFYLNFSDSSNTTATTLGKDQAGSNNWTPNNFSVSAGPGNDSLVDSPTYYGTDTGVGGEVRGNYCTLNPLSTTSGAFVQGNLRYTGPSDWRRANGTMAVSSGKWYYEVTLGNSPFGSGASDSWNAFGFGLATGFASTTTPSAVSDAVILSDAQHYKNFSGSYTSLGTSFSSGDVLSVAVDLGANTFKFYRNNSQLVTGTIGGTAGRELVPVIISYNGSYGVMDVNFGQRPFIHAAPSGFRALRDYNKLPTPTGGEVRGNYATLNPISTIKGNIIDGNLTTNGGDRGSISTIGMTSGKWYCEMYVTAVGAESSVGISRGLNVMNPYIGSTSDSWGYYFNGLKYNNGSGTSYGSSYTTGDTIGAAFDADVGTIVFYKNGISQGTAYTSLTSGPYYFATSGRSSTSANNVTMNFGQRPWAYDAPFGFLPLCTTLLPQPIVQKSSSYMDVVTYTGNGAASRSITGLGFSPDLVWLKARSLPYVHGLHDTVRGASRFLASNSTASELINEADGSISAFNSDGFTISSGSNSNATFNTNTSTYVAWAWDESPIAGMDIVGYTGTGSNMTISHSLGVTPKMIINKLRSGTGGWPVYHASLGNTGAVQLESTGAFNVSSTYWNNTSPTSSNFTVAAGLAVNGATYINYVFAEVEGFSKFGSYTGNGSADGPFVWCGFRPRWVLFKESSASGNNWNIYDTARDVSNPEALQLKASAADAEGSNTFADYTSNGFKVRVSTAGINSSGQTYIFAAFAESPFKYARAR